MWSYGQTSGRLVDPDGQFVCAGYSGFGPGKNNPVMQGLANIGPIPQGLWHIGEMVDLENFGTCVMRLSPAPGTKTLGRWGFLIHGDSAIHPGYSSHGCVILPRPVRLRIGASKDRVLEVVA